MCYHIISTVDCCQENHNFNLKCFVLLVAGHEKALQSPALIILYSSILYSSLLRPQPNLEELQKKCLTLKSSHLNKIKSSSSSRESWFDFRCQNINNFKVLQQNETEAISEIYEETKKITVMLLLTHLAVRMNPGI